MPSSYPASLSTCMCQQAALPCGMQPTAAAAQEDPRTGTRAQLPEASSRPVIPERASTGAQRGWCPPQQRSDTGFSKQESFLIRLLVVTGGVAEAGREAGRSHEGPRPGCPCHQEGQGPHSSSPSGHWAAGGGFQGSVEAAARGCAVSTCAWRPLGAVLGWFCWSAAERGLRLCPFRGFVGQD